MTPRTDLLREAEGWERVARRCARPSEHPTTYVALSYERGTMTGERMWERFIRHARGDWLLSSTANSRVIMALLLAHECLDEARVAPPRLGEEGP